MPPTDSPAQFIPLVGAVLALLCLVGSYRAGKRGRLIDQLPTSKTTGVFIGLVELKGTAKSSAPLTSYLAGGACVWYAWGVEERWSRTVTETYTDSEGKTQTRTRHESGWTTVASGGEMIPFFVQDDEGLVLVQPEGAKVEPVTVFDERCGRSDALYYAKGPSAAVFDSDHVRRFHECVLPLHAELYVMGQARERADVVAPEIAADQEAPLFLISTRTEQQVSRGFKGSFWGWGVFGFVLAVAGFVIAALATDADIKARWPLFAVAAASYLFAAALGWTWLAFNSLIDLRQRVRRAWAQMDVQLKLRHDLIPNLLEVVKGYRDYEQTLQAELAALRTQIQATAPGIAGPDFRALKPAFVAIAERYPELKADTTFAQLQRNLIDTEQRIALARGYFNDIATHYNTRLESVPDKFVAALGAMRPQPLLEADEFERAPVKVEFASAAPPPLPA
jgi:hypothetical protein